MQPDEVSNHDHSQPLELQEKCIVFKLSVWELFQECPVCNTACPVVDAEKGVFFSYVSRMYEQSLQV